MVAAAFAPRRARAFLFPRAMKLALPVLSALWLISGVPSVGSAGEAAAGGKVSHGLAMHEDIKYGPEFIHFDYVNPDAPKGGEARLASIGTFDTLNPFIIKGVPADGIGLLFESLMISSNDEPFTEYGLIAESIEVPDDRSWVVFTLRPEARWHDGTPITVDDVIFSFETLREQGNPFFRAYYASVAEVEKLDARRVEFTFVPGENRELPLILGQLPILSKAYYSEHEFNRTSLEPPMASGPYRVESVDPGRSITYRRDPDYWGWHLPVNQGRHNFDVIRYEYYRDATVALEAFKTRRYDFRNENSSRQWATAYTGPPFVKGLIVKEEIQHQIPTGMQAFVFNIRRAKFADPRVREALGYAFDFEWTNRTLFYGAYTRTKSYFSNSELASRGLPSEAELELLEPFRGQIPDEVLARAYEPPSTDGSGNNRANLREAMGLLKEAGWTIENGKLVGPRTGEPMEIEFLLVSQEFERVVAPMVQNLRKLGIKATIRTVDTPQYQGRLQEFDFDIVVETFPQSLSPGNEQREFWGSAYADIPGSRNIIGTKNPVVDALVEKVIAAPDRDALIAACRALDRVLLWDHYVIPQWHIRSFRVAYWNKFGRPKTPPKYALGFLDTWWVDPAKKVALERGQGASTVQ